MAPEEILDVLHGRRVSYQKSDIPFWPSWEAGKIEVTDLEFVEAVLGAHAESNMPVIIVFADCFSSAAAYRLPASQTSSLLAHAEDDNSLFQPLDHIFYLELQSILIMVHHDGKVITAEFIPGGVRACSFYHLERASTRDRPYKIICRRV